MGSDFWSALSCGVDVKNVKTIVDVAFSASYSWHKEPFNGKTKNHEYHIDINHIGRERREKG